MKVLLVWHLLFLIDNVFGNIWTGSRIGPGNFDFATPNVTAEEMPQERWIDQILDHDNSSDNRMWKQRYFMNDSFYEPGGPVFLLINEEAEADPIRMTQGAMMHYASEQNALCFQVEHRFYGQSRPTSDVSLENLSRYYSTGQALDDLAHFIKLMNKKHRLAKDTKWIAFGASYAGCLAAQLRLKHKQYIYGAVSSSCAVHPKVDLPEYLDRVRGALENYSKTCVQALKEANVEMKAHLKSKAGQKIFNEKFRLCDPIEKSVNDKMDLANLFEIFADNIAGVVQYDKNNQYTNLTVSIICDVMDDLSIGSPFDRAAVVSGMILDQNGDSCLDYRYDKLVQNMRNASYDSEKAQNGLRQWTFQTCNEFGYFQTSGQKDQIFGSRFPLDFWFRLCADFFGASYDREYIYRAVERSNQMYLGRHPATTNVLYVNGEWDPWHALQLTHSNDPNLPTVYIKGGSHCTDLYEPRSQDSPQLKLARIKIRLFLRNLLAAKGTSPFTREFSKPTSILQQILSLLF